MASAAGEPSHKYKKSNNGSRQQADGSGDEEDVKAVRDSSPAGVSTAAPSSAGTLSLAREIKGHVRRMPTPPDDGGASEEGSATTAFPVPPGISNGIFLSDQICLSDVLFAPDPDTLIVTSDNMCIRAHALQLQASSAALATLVQNASSGSVPPHLAHLPELQTIARVIRVPEDHRVWHNLVGFLYPERVEDSPALLQGAGNEFVGALMKYRIWRAIEALSGAYYQEIEVMKYASTEAQCRLVQRAYLFACQFVQKPLRALTIQTTLSRKNPLALASDTYLFKLEESLFGSTEHSYRFLLIVSSFTSIHARILEGAMRDFSARMTSHADCAMRAKAWAIMSQAMSYQGLGALGAWKAELETKDELPCAQCAALLRRSVNGLIKDLSALPKDY